jgi:hypothetical protein
MKLGIVFVALLLFCATAIPLSIAGQTRGVWVAPRSGIWNLKGSDETGTQWSAEVKLRRTKQKGKFQLFRGDFTWKSADGNAAGREFFTGRFDRRTGLLRLESNRVVAEKGDLGIATYVGFSRSKGRKIARGKWNGPNVVPGTWSAQWVKLL